MKQKNLPVFFSVFMLTLIPYAQSYKLFSFYWWEKMRQEREGKAQSGRKPWQRQKQARRPSRVMTLLTAPRLASLTLTIALCRIPGWGKHADYPTAEISFGHRPGWWWLEQIPRYGIWEWNQKTTVAGVWKLHLERVSYRKGLDAYFVGDERSRQSSQKEATSRAGFQAHRCRFLLH